MLSGDPLRPLCYVPPCGLLHRSPIQGPGLSIMLRGQFFEAMGNNADPRAWLLFPGPGGKAAPSFSHLPSLGTSGEPQPGLRYITVWFSLLPCQGTLRRARGVCVKTSISCVAFVVPCTPQDRALSSLCLPPSTPATSQPLLCFPSTSSPERYLSCFESSYVLFVLTIYILSMSAVCRGQRERALTCYTFLAGGSFSV